MIQGKFYQRLHFYTDSCAISPMASLLLFIEGVFINVHVYIGVVVLFLAALLFFFYFNMVKKTYPLSDVLHVTVTKQSQVQFINKTVEKAIGETFVNFTLPHWISFVSVARPKIRNAIKERKEKSFLYHGNRKVAKVLHKSDTTAYQVHLMTFTAKGVPKRDLCVLD